MNRDGNMFQNMGIMILGAFLAGFIGISLFITFKLLWKKVPLVKKIGTKIYDIVIFNAFLRSFV
jgi:hypothetical protein